MVQWVSYPSDNLEKLSREAQELGSEKEKTRLEIQQLSVW